MRKPYERMSREEKIAVHRKSIAALRYTMSQGDNRFGSYGDNCREAIASHEASIARLEANAS